MKNDKTPKIHTMYVLGHIETIVYIGLKNKLGFKVFD